MRATSAYANKMLKQLNEEKEFWLNKEKDSMLYVAAAEEVPVIPDYNYVEVASKLEAIDRKICKIKHAINQANINSEIDIFGEKYTIDFLLVRMAQINKRKMVLDKMRKQLPKSRVDDNVFSARKSFVEYRYVNYDLERVQKDFDEVSKLLFEMQLKLDEHNQNAVFDIDID